MCHWTEYVNNLRVVIDRQESAPRANRTVKRTTTHRPTDNRRLHR